MKSEEIVIIIAGIFFLLFLLSFSFMPRGYGMMGFYGFGSIAMMGVICVLVLIALVLFILWLIKQLESEKRARK